MYRGITAQPVDECQSSLFARILFRPVYAVHQLGNGNYRESNIHFAVAGPYLLEYLSDTVATAFRGDNNAGV